MANRSTRIIGWNVSVNANSDQVQSLRRHSHCERSGAFPASELTKIAALRSELPGRWWCIPIEKPSGARVRSDQAPVAQEMVLRSRVVNAAVSQAP
jgi:hypothetical protein